MWTTSIAISCRCGSLTGAVHPRGRVNRCVCYCDDCQAFARFLKRQDEVLDDFGGTEIIHLSQGEVSLSKGTEQLACMRLTANGTLRWYAGCCSTPIANTLPNRQIPVAGLVQSCLDVDQAALDAALGPVDMQVFTKYALQTPAPKMRGLVPGMARVLRVILRARLHGDHHRSPFFHADTGKPVVVPKVLSDAERAEVKAGLV
ncbi:DUF6151 family protein [Fodinicurvata halophila]|uniref:DUF6151 family protein n=1 Tax=Fodinicurvata halophila TaxID=1419723 RepID=A0ABV8UR37_9PROT